MKDDGSDIVDGVFPTVLPEDSMKGSDGKYAWNCGATYKGYMQYYINKAREKGAIPVIVSPVARMYYNSDGTIRPHHDSTATDYAPTSKLLTSNNSYVTACKQVYEANLKDNPELPIYYIDGYALTEKMYKDAWDACGSKANGDSLMAVGDGTHCNKVGGIISAGLIAKAFKELDTTVSKYVVQPETVYGENSNGEYILTIKDKVFTAYNNDFTLNADNTAYGQALFDSLASSTETPDTPDTPDEPTVPVVPAEKGVGDVDGNGFIEVNDAVVLLDKVLDDKVKLDIEEQENYMDLIDVNKDGVVTAIDVAIVSKLDKNEFLNI